MMLLASPASSEPDPITIRNTVEDCGIQGSFTVAVPESIAWEVLTDYDGLDRFVTSLRSSQLERDERGRVVLRQEARATFLLLGRTMLVRLELEESPSSRIRFRDMSGKDFLHYAGEWRLAPEAGGMLVEYDLSAEPRSGIARMLCRRMLRNTGESLLTQVRAEMLRRENDSK